MTNSKKSNLLNFGRFYGENQIYSQTYTGSRYRYALLASPVKPGRVPCGYIINSDKPHPNYKFGTVEYPIKLDDTCLSMFEMHYIDSLLAPKEWSEFTAQADTEIWFEGITYYFFFQKKLFKAICEKTHWRVTPLESYMNGSHLKLP